MKKTVNKTVNLDLVGYNGNAFVILGLFQHQARQEEWSDAEIDAVITEAKSKDYDHLLATILNHCEAKKQSIDPKEVWDVLNQLSLQTHYLADKVIANWDEYDHANYRSLLIKAGRLKKMYGVYESYIKQDDVETTTSHPNFFFKTQEEATAVMEQIVADGLFEADELHVLYRYKKQ
ncbi:MAG: hypothetical protein ACK5M1_04695 [Xanthomarina gelatinilytica]|uniref:hypothetical protein n=1 Tax=Xanthomarina gelatinilytica TaxID=1137281 RepID=UPI003A89EA1F